LLAGVALLGTPFFVLHGASQYADVPFGFFVLSTFCVLALGERPGADRRRMTALAGLLAGLSAWTKNEGQLFLLAVPMCLLVEGGIRRRWRESGRNLLFYAAGAAPVVVVLAIFAAWTTADNDLLAGQKASTIQHLLTASRYLEIGWAFFKSLFPVGFGQWFLNPLPVLAACAMLLGTGRSRAATARTISALGLPVMLGGYFLVYLITPYPLAWHLNGSLNRLMLQLWPTALFTFFLWMQPPEV
jgi:hypothetical protein